MINLTKLLNFFLHDSIQKRFDEKLLLKSTILVSITVMYFVSLVSLILILLVMIALNTIVVWSGVISCTLSSSCYLFQIIYFKKTGNHFIASSMTMAILLGFTTAFTYLTGGWNSPLILFLFVVPMCAFLVTNYRAGTFWSILVIAVYVALGLLEYFGIKTPHVIDQKYETLLIYFSWVFSWAMIVGGVMLYANIVNSLNSSINSEKEKLRLKATFDEESGAYTRKAFSKLLTNRKNIPVKSTSSFALVFMELMSNEKSIPGHTRDTLHVFMNAISNFLHNNVILSRYSSLSITAMISEQENNEAARSMLYKLHEQLQQIMDSHGFTLCLGAVVAPDSLSDIDALSLDARNALLNAKKQQNKIMIYSKGKAINNENNDLSKIIIGTFDKIVKKHG